MFANVLEFGADLVHAHLIDADDARRLSDFAIPTVMTVHNMQRGWPKRVSELKPADVTLLFACGLRRLNGICETWISASLGGQYGMGSSFLRSLRRRSGCWPAERVAGLGMLGLQTL